MLRYAFVVAVVNASCRFTVNAYNFAGMQDRTGIGIIPLPLLVKAFTTSFLLMVGMLPPNHNIALAAICLLVIGAILDLTL
jgi:uncharacterized membrane-anchored protein